MNLQATWFHFEYVTHSHQARIDWSSLPNCSDPMEEPLKLDPHWLPCHALYFLSLRVAQTKRWAMIITGFSGLKKVQWCSSHLLEVNNLMLFHDVNVLMRHLCHSVYIHGGFHTIIDHVWNNLKSFRLIFFFHVLCKIRIIKMIEKIFICCIIIHTSMCICSIWI